MVSGFAISGLDVIPEKKEGCGLDVGASCHFSPTKVRAGCTYVTINKSILIIILPLLLLLTCVSKGIAATLLLLCYWICISRSSRVLYCTVLTHVVVISIFNRITSYLICQWLRNLIPEVLRSECNHSSTHIHVYRKFIITSKYCN